MVSKVAVRPRIGSAHVGGNLILFLLLLFDTASILPPLPHGIILDVRPPLREEEKRNY